MRIHPSCLALALLLCAAAPTSAQVTQVQAVGVDLYDRFAARITRDNGAVFARGDTLRVRSLLVNLSDTVIVADADPCEIRFGGELALEPVGGAEGCRSVPVRVAPGDSAWTERAAVVASPPGRYALEVRNGAFTRRGRALLGISGTTSEVRVVEPGARTVPRIAPLPQQSLAFFPMVLRFRDDAAAGVAEPDAREIVRATLQLGGGGIPLPLHPDAPAAARGVSYLEIVLERESDGSTRRAMAWVDGHGEPCGSKAERTGRNAVQPPVVFGAEMAMWVHLRVDEIRAQGCMSPRLQAALAAHGAPDRAP